jgi:hypothetical protein
MKKTKEAQISIYQLDPNFREAQAAELPYLAEATDSSGPSWNASASSSCRYDDLKRGYSHSMQPPQSGGATTGYHFKASLSPDLERLLGVIAASLLLAPIPWAIIV